MAREVGFGIVGLGMGALHSHAVVNAKGARLAAVCDLDEERLKSVSEKHEVRGYARYRDLLKDPAVDVVNVVTESGYHTKMAIEALRAGKHIIVEKPVDVKPAKISRLEKAVAESGLKCGCVFQSRVSPVNVALKKALDKGKMGTMFGMHGCLPWFRGQDYFSGPHGPWRGTWALDGGGSLMNQGIHTVDLLVFLGGRVESVCGYFGLHNHDLESEDQAVACLKYANGALGTLFTTTCSVPEGAQQLYGFGSKGSFRKEGEVLTQYEMGTPRERERMIEKFGGAGSSDAASKDPMAVATDGHRILIEDMVKAIRQDREPLIPLREARHAVEVACAIYKSSRTGRAVKV